jgi:hypothetical protein
MIFVLSFRPPSTGQGVGDASLRIGDQPHEWGEYTPEMREKGLSRLELATALAVTRWCERPTALSRGTVCPFNAIDTRSELCVLEARI